MTKKKLAELNEPSPEEEMARKVAHIIGESSAAAQALRDLDKRRAAGQIAWLTYDGRTWFVGGAHLTSTTKNQPKGE